MLLEPQYQEAYTAWRNRPTPAAASVLLSQIQPVLDSAVHQYGAGGPTLMSRARLLAIQALKSYDPSRGKLKSHLMSYLQGLRRYAARQSQIIRLPERVALEMGYLRRSQAELQDQLGRTVSTQELADYTNLSPAKITRLRNLQPGLAEGQTIQTTDEGEDELAPAVVDPRYHEAWMQYLYPDLAPEDQLLLEHTTGLHGAPLLSKSQLAGKLQLSPSAVSQRLKKLQEKLDFHSQAGSLFGGSP